MNPTNPDEETLTLLRDNAARVLADAGGLRRVRSWRWRTPGFDREAWRDWCALGWPGVHLAEDAGGSGLGTRGLCELAETLGAGLAPEPLVGAALAARLLDPETRAAQLSGKLLVLPAWQDHANQLGWDQARLRHGRVSGIKRFVAAGPAADAFVVATDRGPVRVARDAPGLRLNAHDQHDGGVCATLVLDNTPARALDGDLQAALEEATLATAAYLLGLAQRAFELTLEHLRLRHQFGRAIGSFQALQHRAVDLQLQLALTRASVDSAATRIDSAPGGSTAALAVSRAKARAAETALRVTREAVQMHGAIGYTDEHDIGLYLLKAMTLAPAFGSAGVHRARHAELSPP